MSNNIDPLNKNSLSSLSFLFLGGLVSSICIFVTQVILARELSSNGFGNLMSAIALITLMSPLALFGVSDTWLKVYGSEGSKAHRWLKISLKLVFLSLAFTLLVLVFWAFYGPHDESYRFILLCLLPLLLSHILIELVNTRFQLEAKYISLAFWQNLIHFLRFFYIIFFYYFAFRPLKETDVVSGYLVISLGLSLIGFYYLYMMIKGKFTLALPLVHKNKETTNKQTKVQSPLKLREIFLKSTPFGLAGLFYLIYLQSDLIFLKYLVGEQAAGIYAAAFSIMLAVYYFPGVIYQKYLLPKIHAWANFDKETLLNVFQVGNGLMLATGFFVFIFIFCFSPLFMPLLFGSEYTDSGKALRILAICIPIRFLATSVESPLFTLNLMKWKTCIMGLAAFINIVLNFFLIPSFSYIGAAIATVVSESILLFLYLLTINLKVFGKDTWKGWWGGFSKSFWKHF